MRLQAVAAIIGIMAAAGIALAATSFTVTNVLVTDSSITLTRYENDEVICYQPSNNPAAFSCIAVTP